jgi:hypothetical protein
LTGLLGDGIDIGVARGWNWRGLGGRKAGGAGRKVGGAAIGGGRIKVGSGGRC